ncbi:MAG: glycosyltransferase, partial [Actinomycetota bacterium]|nr:glycosyltransferase [Actinomycetota bacterium]
MTSTADRAAPLVGCTVASASTLAPALVAATSFVACHPDAAFVLVLSSAIEPLPDIADERIQVRSLAEVVGPVPGWRHLVSALDAFGRCFPARPLVVQGLLEAHEHVILLSPHSFVIGDLRSLVPTAAAGCGWTVTPTRLDQVADDDQFDFGADHWLHLPRYHDGCMGFDRRAGELLTWWASQAFETPRLDHPVPGQIIDRWVDVGVATFGPEVVRDPGVGVASWNIDERPITRADDGYAINGEAARHLSLPSFDPTRPWVLAAYDARHPRVSLADTPVLAEICEDYALEVTRWTTARSDNDPMDELVGTLAPVVREVLRFDTAMALRWGHVVPPTPLDPDGGEAFRAWLAGTTDTPGGMPLIAYALWCARPDCREAFPELGDPDDVDGFLRWIEENAAALHPEVAWHDFAPRSAPIPRLHRVGAEPIGVDVIGYLSGQFGLGEAGRRLVDALTAAGVPVSTIAHRDVDHRLLDGHRTDDVFRHDVAILSVNPQETPTICHALRSQLRDRHVIGYWHWEVLHAPPERQTEALALIDEVWAPSSFIADVFEPHAPGRVHAMPYPLAVAPDFPLLSREEVGFDEAFTFLFVFDFYSSVARKNPHALIEAYRIAFAEGDGTALHLKSINGRRPFVAGDLEALRWAARDRSDIVVRDGVVEPSVVQSMIANCDCYVSLHRSEGVGATISDAIAVGRPVIATAFGGNVEFMTEPGSYLVSTQGVTRVGPLEYRAYPADGFWADPDPRHAAELMRSVVDDRLAATRQADLAATRLRTDFSAEVTGDRMRRRLEAIWRERSATNRLGTVRSTTPAPATHDAPIAVTSFDRPDRLARVLASLRAQEPAIDDQRVHLFQDGAISPYSGFVRATQDVVDDCLELFRSLVPGGHVHASRWHLGPAEQALRAETTVFNRLRAPMAYFVGDDVDLAPTYFAALEALWEAARDDPLIGYVNGLGPGADERGSDLVELRAHGLRRDHWLRLMPMLDDYHQLVRGADFRHRPEGAIHDLFLRWGTPSGSTTPEAARLNAALVMRTWGLTSTTRLGHPLVDRRGKVPPAPAWNGSGISLP